MQSNFFYKSGATTLGPVNWTQLQQLASAGVINSKTQIQVDGNWVTAGTINKLEFPKELIPTEAFTSPQRTNLQGAPQIANEFPIPQYGAAVSLATFFSIVGSLGIVFGVFLLLAALGASDGGQTLLVASVMIAGGIADLALGSLLSIAVDVGRHSVRQTNLLTQQLQLLQSRTV